MLPNNKLVAGVLLLLVGVLILLGKLGAYSFVGSVFWPLLLLIPAILLHVLYFGKILPAETLVPAGILLVYSLLFIICSLAGWGVLRYMWPMFTLGIAVGLYEYYLFGTGKQRVLFTAAVGLAIASLLFFLLMLIWNWGIYLIAAIMIGGGTWIVATQRKKW